MSQIKALQWFAFVAIVLTIPFSIIALVNWIRTPMRPASGLNKALPDREIVFLTGDLNVLGFIHPDGSGYETRKVDLSAWNIVKDWAPQGFDIADEITWSPGGKALVGRFAVTNRGSGVPFIISANGQPTGCSKNSLSLYGSFRSWFQSDTQVLTVNYSATQDQYTVLIVDLTECKLVKTLYTSSAGEGIEEANLSFNGWLAITVDHAGGTGEILVMNPKGQEILSIPSGKFPTWSPDGRFIAYSIPLDGLYVIEADGSGRRKLVTNSFPNDLMPSWSPDGKWLVYNRDSGAGSGFQNAAVIFKIDVTSGKEYELFRGGVNPNWRWDSSTP